MTRTVNAPVASAAVFAVLVALALAAGPASAQDEQLYDLSKLPKVKVGDQFKVTDSTSQEIAVTTADGQTVRAGTEEEKRILLYEVLAVDRSGLPTQIRCTAVKAQLTVAAKAPTEAKVEATIADVSGTAKRIKDGTRFAPDTTTLASGKMKALTATQVALVKRIFAESMGLPSLSEDRYLMPEAPVAVGATWKPSAEALAKWVKSKPDMAKMGIKVKSAQFKLATVEGNTASVSGTIKAAVEMGGLTMQVTAKLAGKLDLKTGIWLEQSVQGTVEGGNDQVTARMVAKSGGVAEYKPGSGTASELADDLTKLGWPAPGEDTNSYKNAAAGVSLDLPKGYQPTKDDPVKDQVARFASKKGVQVVITQTEAPVPLNLDELGPEILKGLKNIPDFTLASKKAVRLPGNVPGELLTATCHEGKVTMLTLYAIDGDRVVSVSVAGPNADDELVAEARKIAQSLRVFERDQSAKPDSGGGGDEP